MSDQVLFELRVQPDGEGCPRWQVYTAPEWEAYHQHRGKRRAAAGSTADDLRRVLDSLQTIYNDLYGDALA